MYQVFHCLSAAIVQANPIKLAAIKFASLSKKVFILLFNQFNQEFEKQSNHCFIIWRINMSIIYEEWNWKKWNWIKWNSNCVFIRMSIDPNDSVLHRHLSLIVYVWLDDLWQSCFMSKSKSLQYNLQHSNAQFPAISASKLVSLVEAKWWYDVKQSNIKPYQMYQSK